jgi:hypothetical protein
VANASTRLKFKRAVARECCEIVGLPYNGSEVSLNVQSIATLGVDPSEAIAMALVELEFGD